MVIILLLGFRTGNRPDASAAGHDIQPRLLCQPQHHQRRGDSQYQKKRVPHTGLPCDRLLVFQKITQGNILANSADEHGVAVGEKAILHFHGLGIRLKHPFPARQRRDEHQQRGFGQMEVGDQAIKDMKKRFDIGDTIPEIREEDIPKLAHYADKEANPLYPVPVLMNAKELETFYYDLMEKPDKKKEDTL